MTDTKYTHLMAEVDAINAHLGTVGVLDALIYIQTHIEHYDGTAALREFKQFMQEGARMFAPAAETV
jgi:hypothetical protein